MSVSEHVEKAKTVEKTKPDSETEVENTSQKPLVRTKWLCKTYPLATASMGRKTEFYALNGVSLEIFPGEALSIVGESGSGKTTLARLMMGLEKPSHGEIYFRKKRIDQLRGRKMTRPLLSRPVILF